jgi:hypothetical protein
MTSVVGSAQVVSAEALGVCLLPIEQLRCRTRLRPGAPRVPRDGLKELPLRVVPAEEPGAYEVLDGFYAEYGTMRSSARPRPPQADRTIWLLRIVRCGIGLVQRLSRKVSSRSGGL